MLLVRLKFGGSYESVSSKVKRERSRSELKFVSQVMDVLYDHDKAWNKAWIQRTFPNLTWEINDIFSPLISCQSLLKAN